MFGYVKPDRPYLYIKDDTLYNALYCGVCKSIGANCGQCARFTLTYDIAFLSAVVHNIMGKDVVIKRKHCIIHPFTKRPIANRDEISDCLAVLNIILAYYKVNDDVADSGKHKLRRIFLLPIFKRAKNKCPKLAEIVEIYYSKLFELEKSGETSIDKIADPFAMMLAKLSDELLNEFATEETFLYFYNFGKWIYIIDALDDYDKDIKKNNYNPFRAAYSACDFESLKRDYGEEVSFILSSCINGISDNLSKIKFNFNADLIRNISLKGTMATTQRVLKGDKNNKGIK